MTLFADTAKMLTQVDLSTDQLEAFGQYSLLLREWNERFNLTAIIDLQEIVVKHFLDSLSCARAWGRQLPRNLIDIGTGAGFPGIPLGIVFPDLRVTLVDSVGKKMDFCKHVVDELKLPNFEFVVDRSEALGLNKSFRHKFDCAVARAVAPLPTLLEYLLPLVRKGGFIIAQKGSSAAREVEKAGKAAAVLGGTFRPLIKVELPDLNDERFLIVLDKIADTPSGYPRRIGLPSKRPIQ